MPVPRYPAAFKAAGLTPVLWVLAVIFLGLMVLSQPRLSFIYYPGDLATTLDEGVPKGFYASQRDDSDNRYTWTAPNSSILFNFQVLKPLSLTFELRSAAIAGGPDAPVQVLLNDRPVATFQPDPRNPGFQSFNLKITPPPVASPQLKLELRAVPYQPPNDRRELGTMVRTLAVDKTEAWSGVGKRPWLLWLIPALGVITFGLTWLAQRFNLGPARWLAIGVAALGAGFSGLLLVLLARIGNINFLTSALWLAGSLYFTVLFGLTMLRLPVGAANGAGLAGLLYLHLEPDRARQPARHVRWVELPGKLSRFLAGVRRVLTVSFAQAVFLFLLALLLLNLGTVWGTLTGPDTLKYQNLTPVERRTAELGVIAQGFDAAGRLFPGGQDQSLAIVSDNPEKALIYGWYWLYPRPLTLLPSLESALQKSEPRLILVQKCKNAGCGDARSDALPQPDGYRLLGEFRQKGEKLGLYQLASLPVPVEKAPAENKSFDLLPGIGLVLLFGLVCYFIGRLWLGFFQVRLSGWLQLGIGLPLGMGTLALQLALYSLVRLPFSGPALYLPWAAIFGWLVFQKVRREGMPGIINFPTLQKPFYRLLALSAWEKLLLFIVGFAFIMLLASQVTTPLATWDSTAMWFMKAKMFFDRGQIDQAGLPDYAHLDYPVAFPLIITSFYLFGPGLNESLALGLIALFLLSAMALLVGYLREKLPLAVCLSLPLIMLAMPALFELLYGPNFLGLADFPLGTAFLLTGVCLALWLADARPGYLALALLSGALAAGLKNEGITFLELSLAIIALSLLVRRKSLPGLLRLPYLWLAAGLVIFTAGGWNLVTRLNGYTTDLASSFSTGRFLEQYPKRSGAIAEILGRDLRSHISYTILGIIILVSLLAFLFVRNRQSLALLTMSALLAGQALTYLVIYVVTPKDLDWHIDTTWKRLIAQLIPLIFFIFGLALTQYHQILQSLNPPEGNHGQMQPRRHGDTERF